MASHTVPGRRVLAGSDPQPLPALPPQHEQRLNAVLSQWRFWVATPALQEQPKVITHLPAGSGHYVVLASAGPADCAPSSGAPDKQQFIVRLAQHTIQRPGYLLSTEARWMLLAHQQKLAPTLVFVDVLNQALVMDYISTETTCKATAQARSEAAPVSPRDIGTLLNAIHQLPAAGAAIDLQAIYSDYLKLAAKMAEKTRPTYSLTGPRSLSGSDAAQRQQGAVLNQLLPADNKDFNRCLALLSTGPQCLCHNDLTRDNVLQSRSGPVAIDWEYAGIGSPWFDIAAALADLSTEPSQCNRAETSCDDVEAGQTPAVLKTDGAQTLTGYPPIQNQHQARQQLLSAACPKGIDAPLLAVAEAVYETIAAAWQATQADSAHIAEPTQIVTQPKALARRLRKAADAAETGRDSAAGGLLTASLATLPPADAGFSGASGISKISDTARMWGDSRIFGPADIVDAAGMVEKIRAEGSVKP